MSAAGVRTTTAWRWTATGTTWQIHHTGGVSPALARRVAEAVAADEVRWSRFLPSSEVARITRGAGRPVAVSRETRDLLDAACRWQGATGGVFTPLAGGPLRGWGYRESVLERPPGGTPAPACSPVDGVVVLDGDVGTVTIPAGTALDLGGIGKSWIARRASRLAAAQTDDPLLLIDAGGDLTAARGEHLVSVERPGSPGAAPMALIRLAEGHGVATSGDDRRRWRTSDGRQAHHLIDPATGAPGAPAHATVVADDVVAADVLAKVLVLRPALIEAMAEPAAVLADGVLRATPAWREVVLS